MFEYASTDLSVIQSARCRRGNRCRRRSRSVLHCDLLLSLNFHCTLECHLILECASTGLCAITRTRCRGDDHPASSCILLVSWNTSSIVSIEFEVHMCIYRPLFHQIELAAVERIVSLGISWSFSFPASTPQPTLLTSILSKELAIIKRIAHGRLLLFSKCIFQLLSIDSILSFHVQIHHLRI